MSRLVFAEYIESGTFQGGEEDVFLAKIKRGEECVVMKKSEYARLTKAIEDLEARIERYEEQSFNDQVERDLMD